MKKKVTITGSIAVTAYLLFTCLPAIAQPDEEKKFLLMYFKEEDLVVESATRSPKPISQTAENITVVTARDIELMNAHTVAEVLNTVTGIEMWLTGGPGVQAVASIEGSEMRHVTVIIDGVVLNNLGANAADLGMIPVQNVEKIEIIKGPASSAWGSALGGVVDIITKSGKKGEGGVLSASYGTKNTGDFRAEASGNKEIFGYYFYAGRLQSDGLTPHFDVSENNGYAKLSYDLTKHTNILFTLGYDKTSRSVGLDTTWNKIKKNVLEILHTTVAVNSVIGKDKELNISFRSLRQDLINRYYNLLTGVPLQDRFLDKGYGSSAKLTWRSAFHTAILGADYDDKTLESNSIIGGEQGIKKWAVYANDTVTLNKFAITPGIRYDYTSTNGSMTSPSLGVAYSLANSTILRAYTAKGFSIPTLVETYGDNVFYTANPDLKVETVWSFQAGVETAAAKYFWIKLSAFRNDMRDVITPEGMTYPLTAVNTERQRRQGVEIAVKTAPVFNVSLSAGAEYIAAKDLDTGERLQFVPKNAYDLGIRYDDEKSLKALLLGHYIDWNVVSNGKYGSFIFDLHVIKKIHQRRNTSLEAFADVHNIFNGSQYPFDTYKNPERWYEGGLRLIF